MNITVEVINSVLFNKTIGRNGRMISGVKSAYLKVYPENMVLFNANLVVEVENEFIKVWDGDLDLTFDHAKLLKLSELSERKLYVLKEIDSENSPVINNYIASYDAFQPQNLQVEVNPTYEECLSKDLNVIKLLKL